jgi:hypothetical protein
MRRRYHLVQFSQTAAGGARTEGAAQLHRSRKPHPQDQGWLHPGLQRAGRGRRAGADHPCKQHTPDTKMPTSPATPETDLPLSPERLKIEPTETVGTVVTSADGPPSPEGSRVQSGEAAVTAMTLIEPLLRRCVQRVRGRVRCDERARKAVSANLVRY